jgi:hypothetical protein
MPAPHPSALKARKALFSSLSGSAVHHWRIGKVGFGEQQDGPLTRCTTHSREPDRPQEHVKRKNGSHSGRFGPHWGHPGEGSKRVRKS